MMSGGSLRSGHGREPRRRHARGLPTLVRTLVLVLVLALVLAACQPKPEYPPDRPRLQSPPREAWPDLSGHDVVNRDVMQRVKGGTGGALHVRTFLTAQAGVTPLVGVIPVPA